MAAKSANVGGQNPEFILREFQGMNNINARESIGDDEFWWCENAIPIGPGALIPTSTALALQNIAAEVNQPSYTMMFNQQGINFIFVVFASSGNAYVLNPNSGTPVRILTGLTSAQTYATAYGNQGLLIIDPTGYWDWNITVANHITTQNNTVSGVTLVHEVQVLGGTSVKQIVTTTGTGATFQTLYQVISVGLVVAGTGYAIGDAVLLSAGSPITPAQIIVASTGGSGAITGISLAVGGSYPGPPSTGAAAILGPSGTDVTTTTGGGTGATFNAQMKATITNVLTQGIGYSNADTLIDVVVSGGDAPPGTVIDSWTISSSGVIGGQSIATYQGRVWISSGRSVFVTDINSFNSFGGAGFSFTINDSYLVGIITVLYSANNYLYIFGQSSIDAVSNLVVTGGVSSFSRINVTGSVGTTNPTSVSAYYRAIIFYHSSGIYLLAGATPERISEKITGIIKASSGAAYAFQVQIQGEICAGMQFTVLDSFTTTTPTQRPLMVMYFRGRWWVASFVNPNPASASVACASLPVNGMWVAFGWRNTSAGTRLYNIFGAGAQNTWLLRTKLWDGGAPVHEKQGINAAIGGQFTGVGNDVSINIDTELASVPCTISPLQGETLGYHLDVTPANEGGTQYLGLTITGTASMSQIDIIALRGKTERDKLQ